MSYITTRRKKIYVDSELGLVLNCAVRYALGRQTYAPGSVTRFISPLLPFLDDSTLNCFDRDIVEQEYLGGYGHPLIDEPIWKTFHSCVKKEIVRRGGETYKTWRNKDVDFKGDSDQNS